MFVHIAAKKLDKIISKQAEVRAFGIQQEFF